MARTVEQLADDNLIAAVRAHARWQAPCEWREENGLLCVAGTNALPIPFRNCVIRTDPGVTPEQMLAAAHAYFDPRRRGFAVMLRDHCDGDIDAHLAGQGLKRGAESPCMLVEQALGTGEMPDGIAIERIDSSARMADAVAVNAAAYEALKLPAAEARLYFSRPDALLADDIEGYVVYRDGEPLATALVLVSGESAGVYWVATLEKARGQGLGELVTRLTTNAGFARGARVVTLQASPFGEPIYRRLGYRVYDHYRRYIVPFQA